MQGKLPSAASKQKNPQVHEKVDVDYDQMREELGLPPRAPPSDAHSGFAAPDGPADGPGPGNVGPSQGPGRKGKDLFARAQELVGPHAADGNVPYLCLIYL